MCILNKEGLAAESWKYKEPGDLPRPVCLFRGDAEGLPRPAALEAVMQETWGNEGEGSRGDRVPAMAPVWHL